MSLIRYSPTLEIQEGGENKLHLIIIDGDIIGWVCDEKEASLVLRGMIAQKCKDLGEGKSLKVFVEKVRSYGKVVCNLYSQSLGYLYNGVVSHRCNITLLEVNRCLPKPQDTTSVIVKKTQL